ncbi:hypothetical protein X777_10273, partial [Ooceraea biroi]
QVQYVKDLISFPLIKDSDWNEDCHTAICEYFKNPACILLSIYFENKLKVRFGIPEKIGSSFTYFLRTPWHVFTIDNFHTTVIFGNINRSAMLCVLKTMENIYVPAMLNINECSESILF